MNKERRRRLGNVYAALQAAKDELDWIREEEQDAYDNLPESLQVTERGFELQHNVENMETAGEALSEAIEALEEILEVD